MNVAVLIILVVIFLVIIIASFWYFNPTPPDTLQATTPINSHIISINPTAINPISINPTTTTYNQQPVDERDFIAENKLLEMDKSEETEQYCEDNFNFSDSECSDREEELGYSKTKSQQKEGDFQPKTKTHKQMSHFSISRERMGRGEEFEISQSKKHNNEDGMEISKTRRKKNGNDLEISNTRKVEDSAQFEVSKTRKKSGNGLEVSHTRKAENSAQFEVSKSRRNKVGNGLEVSNTKKEKNRVGEFEISNTIQKPKNKNQFEISEQVKASQNANEFQFSEIADNCQNANNILVGGVCNQLSVNKLPTNNKLSIGNQCQGNLFTGKFDDSDIESGDNNFQISEAVQIPPTPQQPNNTPLYDKFLNPNHQPGEKVDMVIADTLNLKPEVETEKIQKSRQNFIYDKNNDNTDFGVFE